jgi:SP family general alpha glucoside:H+ symporter-like MFS transporter
MEGYDTLLLGQFYANQSFAKRFGVFNGAVEPPRWEIPAKWQTGLGVSASIGQVSLVYSCFSC